MSLKITETQVRNEVGCSRIKDSLVVVLVYTTSITIRVSVMSHLYSACAYSNDQEKAQGLPTTLTRHGQQKQLDPWSPSTQWTKVRRPFLGNLNFPSLRHMNTASMLKIDSSNFLMSGRAIAQAVSRRLSTAAARVRTQVRYCWDLW
jgi:hypothetical protein